MTSADIICEIVRCGHTVGLDGETLVVRPKMAEHLRERVLANKPLIVAYLRGLGAEAASGHAFTALASADPVSVRLRGVCIACGVPWECHGEPPITSWRLVEKPNNVVLINACAVVAAAKAEAFVSRGTP